MLSNVTPCGQERRWGKLRIKIKYSTVSYLVHGLAKNRGSSDTPSQTIYIQTSQKNGMALLVTFLVSEQIPSLVFGNVFTMQSCGEMWSSFVQIQLWVLRMIYNDTIPSSVADIQNSFCWMAVFRIFPGTELRGKWWIADEIQSHIQTGPSESSKLKYMWEQGMKQGKDDKSRTKGFYTPFIPFIPSR